MQGHIQKNVHALLVAHGSDITDQVRLAVLQITVRGNGLERFQIGPVANDEDIVAIEAASGYGQVAVASVGGHDDLARAVGHLLEPDLDLVEDSLLTVLR